MKLASLFDDRCISLNLKAATRDDAIRELVDIIAANQKLAEPASVVDAILDRERSASTGITTGVAIPHVRIKNIGCFCFAVGVSKKGLDFKAPDGKPVQIIFLILAPPEKNSVMLQTMSALAKLFSNVPKARDIFLLSESPDELIGQIAATDLMVRDIPAAEDIMDDKPCSIRRTSTLKETVRLMFEHTIQAIPVIDEQGTLVGEVTGKQLLSLGIPEYMTMLKNVSFLSGNEPFEEFFKIEDNAIVEDIYIEECARVARDASITEIAFLMVKDGAMQVYVVNENGTLVGTISRQHLINKVLFG